MPTITIPEFWIFRLPCTCPYGSLRADQGYIIIATEEQAWADFYEGKRRERATHQKNGHYVEAVDTYDVDRFIAGHNHPNCTKEKP